MKSRISRCSGASRALTTLLLALLGLTASAGAAHAAALISVSYTGSPGTLELGTVSVAAGSMATVTMENTGDANATSILVVSSDGAITVTGAATMLMPAETDEFTVACEPNDAGDFTSTITISYGGDDPDANVTFDVHCVAPTLWVTPAVSHDFGNTERGTTGMQAFTVLNQDAAETTDLNDVSFAGTNCGDFSDDLGAPESLAAGAMTTVTVSFAPGGYGSRGPCTVTFDDNSGLPDVTVALSGTGTGAIMTLPSSPFDAGTTRIATPVMTTVTVQNTGTVQDLNITDVTIGGTHAANYGISPTTATIAPGGSANFTLTFTPSATGTRTATLTFVHSEPLAQSNTLNVEGTGTEALLTTSPAATLDIGDVRTNGNTTGTGIITMNNPGAATTSVTSISTISGNTGQISITSAVPPPNISIPGGDPQIDMACNPSSPGNKSVVVRIVADEDGTNPDDVTVTCRGIQSNIVISNASAIDFGDVLVGTTASVNRTISNLNDANGATLNATFVSSSGRFSTNPTSITNLAVGGNQNVQFRFSPNAQGPFSGTITINHDDPDVLPIVISVSGNGVRPEIDLVQPAGGTINFGDVEVGTTSGSQTVRIRNIGTSDLTIDSVTRTTGTPGQFAHSGPGSVVLAPNASQDWTVTCSPTSTGAKTTLLRFSNDDANEDPLDVTLQCNGVVAALSVTPTPVQFGDVRVCENTSQNVTLRNNGGASLNVTGLTLSDSQYMITSAPSTPFSIAPSNQEVISIQFEPSAGGNRDGTLTIASSDPSSPRVVTLRANGVVANMSVDTMTHGFGDVRIDQAFPGQLFTWTNTGTADIQVMSIALQNATSDFAIELVSPATLPANRTPGQTVTFRVRATPQSLGSKSNTVLINTNAPAAPCGPASLSVAVSANGVVPDLALSSSALDFGATDVQATPATRDITVMNTGTAPLEVSDLQISGADASRYSVSSSALPFTIPVASSGVVQVTYTPVVVSGGDDATLELTTDAASGMSVQVPLSGRGIDREIVPSVTQLSFPETYRNTDDAPQLAFDIDNNGEAPLAIQMVNTTGGGENAFSIVDQLEDTIGGLSSDSVVVEFNPSSAGDFSATLVIMNDDDQRPRVEIALQGRGRVPNFAPDRGEYDMTAGDCDLSSANPTGCIGVGIPTRLTAAIPEGIRFTNLEPQAFQVRELRLVDDQGQPIAAELFRVVEFQQVDVGPNQIYEIDVEFTAPEPGEYEATLEVYLDNDPERVQFVTIRATAVEVRLRGGGCDAGASGAGLLAGMLLLFGLGLLRRRQPQRVRARRRRRAPWLGLLLLAMAWPSAAGADRTRNLDLGTFRPMPGVESEMLSVETPQVGESGAWFLGFFFNHAVNPLNLESPQIVGMEDSLVAGRTAFDLAFSYALADRFEAGLIVPLLSQSGDDSMVVRGVASASGFTLGDVALHGKARLYDAGPLTLGASATATMPTASDGEFAGVNGPTGHLRGMIGIGVSRIRVVTNAGFRARGTGEFGDLEQGNELTYGLGTSYLATPQISVVGELFGAFGMSGGGSTQGASPLEVALGARYRMSREVSLAAGVGTGILPGIGAPDFRGLVFVTYAPNASPIDELGEIGGTGGPIVDRGDDDADGLINSEDRCPAEPEDMDGFEDEDGCPDPDNDGDGLPDTADPCPLEAEDKDGYKDEDGCPDADNDEDGIPDSKDKCPDVPEDKDGFQDRDGCDDPDNDLDGIPDVIDQCATEAETINGKDDDDGCPDEGESLVMVMPDRIEVFEPIKFVGTSDRIRKSSHNVLGQVAATLRANRDFLRIRIAVHVHPRGSKDLAITKERANAIRDWLTQWGIEPERLEVKGYGSARPLVPKTKRGAAGVNDRVEFIILEKRIKK